MRKSMGSKRKYLADAQITEIERIHAEFTAGEISKIFGTADFGYRRITVERPLRLRVTLAEARIHGLRHLPEVQAYMAWMEQRFGPDCHTNLADLEAELSAHVRAALDVDGGDGKEERKKREKEAAAILRKLLDRKAWHRRVSLSAAVRDFWTASGQSDWPDYNAFVEALREHCRQHAAGPLSAADFKHLRAWLADKDPACARVIAETVSADKARGEAFGDFPGEEGQILRYEPDPDLREFENVPLKRDSLDYFGREVLPHVPDAWIDADKRDALDKQTGVVGYEINFNRYFYRYAPPRPLSAIDADLKAVEAEIAALLGEVTA
jgi:type I restriction enzyme M protein